MSIDFEQFVRARSSALLRTAFLLVGDRGHAEDLLQDVLTRTARQWHRIEGPPEAYVRRALLNAAMNGWKRNRVQESPLTSATDRAGSDPAASVDLRDALVRGLRQLPPRHLELELRTAMQQATDGLVADPFLLSRLPTVRPHRRRGALWTAAAAVLVVVAAATWVGDRAAPPEGALAADPIASDDWGPTRGDLAGDEAFLSAVRREWTSPAEDPAAGQPGLESPQGAVLVLWAGTTPDGPAAVVAQRDGSRLVTRPVLPGPRLLVPPGPEMRPEEDPDAAVFATATSTVVVPRSTRATVAVSRAHVREGGKVAREYVGVPVRSGAAIVPYKGGDTSVLIDVRGTKVLVHADYTTPGPAPTNLLSGFCEPVCKLDSRPDGELSADHEAAFLAAQGTQYEWVRRGPWSVLATTPDRSVAWARQLYLPGEPAQTVVTFAAHGQQRADLLVDDADPRAEASPLVVSVRLPRAQGWLVGVAGTEVTGWRNPGGTPWRDIAATPAALLPTDAAGLELRLSDGTTQVVLSK